MNKKEQRALENRIRDVMEEPAELTSDEIAKIRERAYLGYQQKIENEKQPAREKRKKSGLLRRAVAVFAVAIGLIVMSVVYSVLAPVSVSNANSFIRRAAIWVNDQLHLGISFPMPEEKPDVNNSTQRSFSSVEEASKVLNMPIVSFRISDLNFCGFDVTPSSDSSSVLFLHYKVSDNNIDVSIEKLNYGEVFDASSGALITLSSSIGEVYVWRTEGLSRAVVFYNEYLIEIYSLASFDLFSTWCMSLDVN